MSFKPNRFQAAIFEHVQNGNGHAMIDAVAGSGKTTTIVAALELLPDEANSLFVAFNRHIAEELRKRVPINCEAMTLNSLGNQAIRKNVGYAKIKDTKTEDILWFDVFGGDQKQRGKYYKAMRPVRQLVALFKSYAIVTPTIADCDFLCERYDILQDLENGEYELAMRTHQLGLERQRVIDFDDQIFHPIAFNMDLPKYDYVFVDESQDLNPAQIELVKRSVHDNGMIVAVGDNRQAIYGFRGADPEAMENMATAMKMKRLPLSVCYRCAKRIVVEARTEVPHIEHTDDAPEGLVAKIKEDDLMATVKSGDFILCRTTAPLVEYALKLIRKKRKAFVRGRDFGQNLLNLMEHIYDLDDYEAKMQKSLARRPAVLMTTQDQIDTMRVLIEMSEGIEDVIRQMISDIFDNQEHGIMLSTIHRSKGLETDRVFLIRPDLVPHPRASQDWMVDQEHNLKYIAVTRAKKEFYYVAPSANDDFDMTEYE